MRLELRALEHLAVCGGGYMCVPMVFAEYLQGGVCLDRSAKEEREERFEQSCGLVPALYKNLATRRRHKVKYRQAINYIERRKKDVCNTQNGDMCTSCRTHKHCLSLTIRPPDSNPYPYQVRFQQVV